MSVLKIQRQPTKLGLSFFLVATIFCLCILYIRRDAVYCWRLNRMLSASQLKDADHLSAQLIADFPECGECQFLRAKVARRTGHFTEATDALRAAERLDWNPELLHRERILAVVQAGRTRSVEAQLKSIFASELSPAETEEVYEAMAQGHAIAFDTPEFLKCIGFWLRWRPRAMRPRLLRSQFLFRLGNHSEAVEEYRSLVADHPGAFDARLGLAECLLVLNHPTEAEREFRLCHSHRPSAITALGLARSLIRIDQGEEAIGLLESFSDTHAHKTRAAILEELGRWYLDRQQVAEAIQKLEECLRIAPENFSAWHAVSMGYSMTGDGVRAKEALKTGQSLQADAARLLAVVSELADDPASDTLRIEAAEICFRQGKADEAIAWLYSVLNSHPDHLQATKKLVEFRDSSTAVQTTDP